MPVIIMLLISIGSSLMNKSDAPPAVRHQSEPGKQGKQARSSTRVEVYHGRGGCQPSARRQAAEWAAARTSFHSIFVGFLLFDFAS